jgi:hypothetical protein
MRRDIGGRDICVVLMRMTIIAEENLTHKVLAGLKNIFCYKWLGGSLDVFLD